MVSCKRTVARDSARATIADFDVKCGSELSAAERLSGGNLQKFIVGREIRLHPKVMLAAQPTWGVDVGAAQLIHRALIALRDAGSAVLVISEELDELFTLCDRIAVLFAGRLSSAQAPRRISIADRRPDDGRRGCGADGRHGSSAASDRPAADPAVLHV